MIFVSFFIRLIFITLILVFFFLSLALRGCHCGFKIFPFVVISKRSPPLTVASIHFSSHADVAIPTPGVKTNVLGLNTWVK